MRTNRNRSFFAPYNHRLRFGACVVLGALATGCTSTGPDEVDFRGLMAGKLNLEPFLDTDGEVSASSSGGCDAGAYDLGTACGSGENSSDVSSGTTLEPIH